MPSTSATSVSSRASLTLVPPSPVTDQIELEIRGGVENTTDVAIDYHVAFYWDEVDSATRVYQETVTVQPGQKRLVRHRVSTAQQAGQREVVMVVEGGAGESRVSRAMTVLDASVRTTGRIGGAWVGLYHWSETEGAPWNAELAQMTDEQWKELVRAMHEVGMNIVVLQEVFRHEAYVGQHDVTVENYPGLAFYPSELYPGRVPIAAHDPIEAILSEADRLGMHVFLGVGMFAWFDFGAESLSWHLRVADELWERYGDHDSFYGWYISEEIEGGLAAGAREEPALTRRHQEIVHFFDAFKQHVGRYAPDKPVMFATNAHHIDVGEHIYPALLANLDILCPFGFHRMPDGDTTGEVAAARLQKLCDEAGSHLWMDMEAFDFGPNGLIPRSVEGLVDDLTRFQNFEKILCYQFPGIMNAPWMTRQPGGPATVTLYEAYKTRLEEDRLAIRPIEHLALGSDYRLDSPPSENYPGVGGSPLTDGWVGTQNYRHRAWSGWLGETVDVTIELAGNESVRSVDIGFLEDSRSGIYLPGNVRVGLSSDGVAYEWFDAEVLPADDGANTPRRRTAKLVLEGVPARVVRIVATNAGVLPPGHPAAGNPSWTFVDEVVVR